MAFRRHNIKGGFVIFLTACIGVLAACSSASSAATKHANKIVIEKSKRTLTLMSGSEILKTYKVALGGEPVGAKDRQGDHKTPEGLYSVDRKNPNSKFHRALHLSYPSPADKGKAANLGVSPGSDVEIHGLGALFGWVGSKHLLRDWTDGCIAVTNEEIDEIYPLVEVGTPVEIKP
jgi:murein L,D-transpeptidase YafK